MHGIRAPICASYVFLVRLFMRIFLWPRVSLSRTDLFGFPAPAVDLLRRSRVLHTVDFPDLGFVGENQVRGFCDCS
jgi:hypothetical protein